MPAKGARYEEATKHGFTLVELLVVIGIIAVLISILLPSLARARQQALLISCSSNMRQVFQALALYAQDNKGYLPSSSCPGQQCQQRNGWRSRNDQPGP